MFKGVLFYGGVATAIVGGATALILPELPPGLQTGPASAAGLWLINNQHWIVLVGILMVLLSVIL